MEKVREIIFQYFILIRNEKKWIFLVTIIFLFGLTVGLLISLVDQTIPQKVIANYANSIDKDLKPGFSLTTYVFERNSFILVITSITSLFFGLTGFLVTFANGSVLGLLFGFDEIYRQINIFQVLLLLLPHGVFEYFSLFLGVAFGIRLGLKWSLKSSRGKRLSIFKQSFKDLLFILPLSLLILLFAAFVEGNLTLRIACLLGGVCG